MVEYTPYSVRRRRLALEEPHLQGMESVGKAIFGDFMCVLQYRQMDGNYYCQMSFEPSHRNLKKFQGEWRIEGTMSFTDRLEEDVVLVEEPFCCYPSQPFKQFIVPPLHGQSLFLVAKFTNLVGMGVTPRPNYFTVSETTDVCLVAHDTKLYLSKAVLAHFSDFFKVLLFGDFAERNRKEIKIEELYNADEFIDLLDLCFGSLLFNGNDAENLLRLADRFLMPAATRKLEMFFVNNRTKFTSTRLLCLADKYKLSFLMSHIMETMTRPVVSGLLRSNERYQLSPSTLHTVMDAMWRLKEQMRDRIAQVNRELDEMSD